MDRWEVARRIVAVLDERVLRWIARACGGMTVVSPILAMLDLINMDVMRTLWFGAIFTYLLVVGLGRNLHEAVAGREWLDSLPPPHALPRDHPFDVPRPENG